MAEAGSGWLSGLGRLIDGIRFRPRADLPFAQALEEAVLGAPRRYTRLEVAELAGLGDGEGRRLWRALGFAEVADDEVLFTARDVQAARLMRQLGEAGVLDPDVREAVARAVAQQMSRLADWQVGMLKRIIAAQSDTVGPQQSLELAMAVVPALESLQDFVWRRHLADAVSRMLVAAEATGAREPGRTGADPAGDDVAMLAVGFADMVGFTRTTRRRTPAELSEMIERFASCTTEVIADGHGRIVKTVGDEVLFVADEIDDAAGIALALRDRVRTEPALPELRIGVAAGEVLVRYGDVYGETVNIASRLTAHARPDTVLVDRTVADALDGDHRFTVLPVRPVSVRGYRRLHPWVLRRTDPGSADPGSTEPGSTAPGGADRD